MTPAHQSRFHANPFQSSQRQAPSRTGAGQPGSSSRDAYPSPAPRDGYSTFPVSDTAISQADGEA